MADIPGFKFGPVPVSADALPGWLPNEFYRLGEHLREKFSELETEDGKKTLAASGSNSVAAADTRDDTDAPSHFDVQGLYLDFKRTVNSPGTDANAYTGHVVFSPWSDDTGGGVHLLAFGGGGRLEHVFGTRAGGWGTPSTIVEAESIAPTSPAMLNSWADYSVAQPIKYMRFANGLVMLRGAMKSGTLGAAAFSLPAGCRPAHTEYFTTAQPAGVAESRVYVASNGDVVPEIGSTAFFSLGGISFYAEN